MEFGLISEKPNVSVPKRGVPNVVENNDDGTETKHSLFKFKVFNIFNFRIDAITVRKMHKSLKDSTLFRWDLNLSKLSN